MCFTVENGTLPYNILIDGEQIPPSTDALNFCIDGLSPVFYVITVTDVQLALMRQYMVGQSGKIEVPIGLITVGSYWAAIGIGDELVMRKVIPK